MEHEIKSFVGLDLHKDSIAVAIAEVGRAPARLIGSIAHDMGKLVKLLARHGEPAVVQVVNEAGRGARGPRQHHLDWQRAREAAWNYRFPPRIGLRAQRRAEDLPQAIRDVA